VTNALRHKVVGDELSRGDWEGTDAHVIDGQTANDMMLFNGTNWYRAPALALFDAGALVFSAGLPQEILDVATIIQSRFGSLVQICDGANDQVEWLAAIGTGGKRVRVLGPTFSFGAGLNTSTANNYKVVADGIGACVVTLANGVNADAIICGDLSTYTPKITFEGFRLVGNSANNTAGSGIHLKSTETVWLNELEITDFKEHGVHGEGAVARNCAYEMFHRCYIHDNKKHGVYADTKCYAVLIPKGNILAGNGKGVDYAGFSANGNSDHSLSCLFDENGTGARFYASSYTDMSGCVFLNQERDGVLADGTSTHLNLSNMTIISPSTGNTGTYCGVRTDGTNNNINNNIIRALNNAIGSAVKELPGADLNSISLNNCSGTFSGGAIVVVGASTVSQHNVA
jgi:hypothetical protein